MAKNNGKSIKRKFINWYIDQRNRYGKGQGELGYIKHFIEIYALVAIYLKVVIDIQLTWFILLTGCLFLVVIYWAFGYWWDKKGLFILEQEWSNQRNKFVKELREKYHIKERFK